MSEIEQLQMKLSHVKRDFDNLYTESKRKEHCLCEYIRVLMRHMGKPEDLIETEIQTLLTPLPGEPKNNGQGNNPTVE